VTPKTKKLPGEVFGVTLRQKIKSFALKGGMPDFAHLEILSKFAILIE
jgi:hypothetical protein